MRLCGAAIEAERRHIKAAPRTVKGRTIEDGRISLTERPKMRIKALVFVPSSKEYRIVSCWMFVLLGL
jgi:hypothetical protein